MLVDQLTVPVHNRVLSQARHMREELGQPCSTHTSLHMWLNSYMNLANIDLVIKIIAELAGMTVLYETMP